MTDSPMSDPSHVFAQPDRHAPRVLVPITVTPLAIAGLAAHESAHQLASGEAFRVALHRVASTRPGWHVLQVESIEVDPTTGAAIGEPLPPERVSIPVAMAADGTITLDGVRAEQVQRTAQRLLHHRAHQTAFAALPELPSTATTE
jgi:hypothetical protein